MSFKMSFERAVGVTIVDVARCFQLYEFANSVAQVPGDIAEVGVYRGGTARILVDATQGRQSRVHLFDTFTGIPSTADPRRDQHRAGDFGDTSAASIVSMFKDDTRVTIHPGYFPDTAKNELLESSRFALVHVDVDIYQSVLDCATWFYPRLSEGGLLVFDDYGFPSCPGAKAAVDEFFRDKPDGAISLPTGQCFVLRRIESSNGS